MLGCHMKVENCVWNEVASILSQGSDADEGPVDQDGLVVLTEEVRRMKVKVTHGVRRAIQGPQEGFLIASHVQDGPAID